MRIFSTLKIQINVNIFKSYIKSNNLCVRMYTLSIMCWRWSAATAVKTMFVCFFLSLEKLSILHWTNGKGTSYTYRIYKARVNVAIAASFTQVRSLNITCPINTKFKLINGFFCSLVNSNRILLAAKVCVWK